LIVVSVNISERKGTPKTPVEKIELVCDHGVKGDAHAGPGDRQVSLLAIESYQRFEKSAVGKMCLKHGSFGENIVTEGIVLHELNIGDGLIIGDALLRVSKIGKECHAPCAIAKAVGKCIMPVEGIFARVESDGSIRPGDKISIN
jgi:cyclic pyranopterin monophosphate synthase